MNQETLDKIGGINFTEKCLFPGTFLCQVHRNKMEGSWPLWMALYAGYTEVGDNLRIPF